MREVDVVIVGAGAAGLMCAIEAGRRGRRVLLLDHADRIGKKILISGGGRSNFTNLHCTSENFLSENPHFAKSALARFCSADMVALVEKHGIPYHEKTLGQLFCDRNSRDIVDMLERECAETKVEIQLETRVSRVVRNCEKASTTFTLETSSGIIRTQSLVVATGGLSIPKMGATSFGYDLARQFGLNIIECRPGLVPFTFDSKDRNLWCDLAGVSTEVEARVISLDMPTKSRRRSLPNPCFREKTLITHRGLSGPAMLQISSFWKAGDSIELDLAPGQEVFAPLLLRNARRDADAALHSMRALLPARWAERWLSIYEPSTPTSSTPMGDLSNTVLAALELQVHTWQITPDGTEGYAKAEVTAGGVDTAELDAKTMQSRKVPGLFFIGEVVDVTGWLGGFNFQWAWASGFSAGRVV